ncbi:hypothetical protein IKQ26_05850 [bacterium]|nr:hypothetical protein [bacterium]
MVLCDTIAYIENNLWLHNTEDCRNEKEKAYIENKNRAIRKFAELYETGELAEKGFVEVSDSKTKKGENARFIDFVVDLDKLDLDEDFLNIFPKSPCIYSGCISFCEGLTMQTYRDYYGCIGRSWEIATVQVLDNLSAEKISKVRREKGSYQAGIYAIKLCKTA